MLGSISTDQHSCIAKQMHLPDVNNMYTEYISFQPEPGAAKAGLLLTAVVTFWPGLHQPAGVSPEALGGQDTMPKACWSQLLGQALWTSSVFPREEERAVPGHILVEDQPGDGLWLWPGVHFWHGQEGENYHSKDSGKGSTICCQECQGEVSGGQRSQHFQPLTRTAKKYQY